MRIQRGLPLRAVVGALIVAGVAVVPPAVAAVPVCAPGQGTVVLEGTVSSDDIQTYELLPFEVAAGTTRVEVAYTWGDSDPLLSQIPTTQTVVDLGLWDADGAFSVEGFRGWGGSRQGVIHRDMPPVWVQADSADRGFYPGTVEPGMWNVELGYGWVNEGGGTWRVEITCLDVPVGPEPTPDPVDVDHVADPDPGWYHGDFHMHAYHSNPEGPTNDEVASAARDAGLDFLPITEYVTTVHQTSWGATARANPDLVVWPGREIITYHGHANALGETPNVVDYRHGFEDITLADIQAATVADGALFQINHPTIFPGPALSSFCRGCEFELLDHIDLDQVATIEVLTGPVEVDPSDVGGPATPQGGEQPFVRTAIDLWEDLLSEGHRITGVGSSDSKQAAGHGVPATAVYAEELSRPALVDALRRGRAYVRTRGVAASPELEFTAVAAGEEVMFGGTLVADQATLSITVRGGQGHLIEISRNGVLMTTVPVATDEFTVDHPAFRGLDGGPLGTFYRVDVRDPEGILSAIGNPIFLSDTAPTDTGGGTGGGSGGGTGDAGADDGGAGQDGGPPTTPVTGGGATLVALLALAAGALSGARPGRARRRGHLGP